MHRVLRDAGELAQRAGGGETPAHLQAFEPLPIAVEPPHIRVDIVNPSLE